MELHWSYQARIPLLAMLQLLPLLAFAVVSHTGILVIGLFSLNHMAFQGSVMLSVTFGLAIATLFFMTGLVYRSTLLTRMGGLFDHLPFVGIASWWVACPCCSPFWFWPLITSHSVAAHCPGT